MNRALFVTTATSEPIENVNAWEHFMGPSAHVVFDINGPPKDEMILARAREFEPEVIFYTGGESGDGLPSDETLISLREIAPSVIIQGDMADPPWHEKLAHYKKKGCFTLQVGMDGVLDSPVDHVTLTPFNLKNYEGPRPERTLRCGFAGNFVYRERFDLVKKKHSTSDPRSEILHHIPLDLIDLRRREITDAYSDYVAFLHNCHMIINTSWAGSGTVHHVKGRVLESAFAGCVLLEMEDSPTRDWFPKESYFTYSTPDEAVEIIRDTPPEEVVRRAKIFEAHARKHYSPETIYKGILAQL